MKFDQVLTLFAEVFERENIRYAIVGGLAIHAWGRSRSTQDIDFVVDGAEQQRVIALARSLGYETLQVNQGYSNHEHPSADFGRVDFIYVYGSTADKLFEGATNRIIAGGTSIPVPRAEHLVAMKVVAMKNNHMRVLIDSPDVSYLMSLPGVDLAEIRDYFVRHGLLTIYDGLAKDLGLG
jgi:hypothetical protein